MHHPTKYEANRPYSLGGDSEQRHRQLLTTTRQLLTTTRQLLTTTRQLL